MQLNRRSKARSIVAALGLAVGELLAATPALAQDAPVPLPEHLLKLLRSGTQHDTHDKTERKHKHTDIHELLSARAISLLRGDAPPRLAGSAHAPPIMEAVAPGVGTSTAESAVLFYQEEGGRVRAIEPTANVTVNQRNGNVLTASATFDSLTGATPNGALRSAKAQTFAQTLPGSAQSTTTGASGRTTVPSTTANGLVQSSYVVPAGALPLDQGFKDHRVAASLGFSTALATDTRVKLGAAASVERDYASYSGTVGLTRDLDQKNTTLSLAMNFEHDLSHPFYGTPKGFDPLINQISGGNQTKDVISTVAGITQTMSRRWLAQLNFEFGSSQGYQSDPYKVLSLINVADGTVANYLYENRPRHRNRMSVFFLNKYAFSRNVAELSVRYYHDSWGVNSVTAQLSDRIGLGKAFYVEPVARYYKQTAANFFRYYLDSSEPLPDFASADGRLSRFDARTVGVKFGVRLSQSLSAYIDGEDYQQIGSHAMPNAPASLANVDVFSGTHSFSATSGLRLGF